MDRRVIRTKKAIRAAFLTLMIDKDMDKITIKEIAEKADVDRKTVYNYYKGVGEIFGEIENELVSHFEDATHALEGQTDPKTYFAMLAQLIEKDMDMYELLMRSNNSTFIAKTVEALSGWIEKALNKKGTLDPEKVGMVTEYVTAGIFCAYRRWFHSDRKKPLQEFSLDLCELVVNGLFLYIL